ncbi:Photosystem II 12 kDa extrinsic protein [subsurface metagenome]
MKKKIILRHRNFNKQKTGQAKRAVILVGILALGLILLAGCRQRPEEVELEKKELIPLEEMVPLEPMAEKAPMVAEAPPAVAPTPYAPAAVTGKININTATQAQLETLPRIGPVTAQAIIANRPFASIEEITKVPRIGPKTYENLKNLITVGGAAAPAPTAAPTPTAPAAVTGKINVNTATQAQLETLPRIGPVTAQAIMAGRPYSSIEDLDRVPRIGPKTLENLRPLVTVK